MRSSTRAGSFLELPPRTRRIRMEALNNIPPHGTTSAYAENTQEFLIEAAAARNYLRVRGEYRSLAANIRLCMELPPRTRRIPVRKPRRIFSSGTTSAYAENTYGWPYGGFHPGNYLRVRGEYLKDKLFAWNEFGTTSAYAENTETLSPRCCCCGNYLRVRGEYQWAGIDAGRIGELPPRTRRIP